MLVPNLILQPLVENAVRHGIAPRAAGGRVEIRARQEPGPLVIEVVDDGPGAHLCSLREGVGVANTRARLRQLYGDAHNLSFEANPGGGFRVRLSIPAHALAIS